VKEGPAASNLEDRVFGGNLFPDDDPRHELWTQMCRLAAEEDFRFKSRILERNPKDLALYLDLFAGWFDIRAKWLMPFIVSNYANAQIYEEMLARMVNAVLTWAQHQSVARLRREGLFRKLRLRLSQRSAHWMEEALAQAREAERTRKGEHTAENQPCLWEDVKIEFTSERQVQITVKGRRLAAQNFAEMGFEDQKSKNPIKAWLTLRELAEGRGEFKPGFADKGHCEKSIQAIRRLLREHIKRAGYVLPPANPVSCRKGTYRTLFGIGTRPSYDG
jgi:hypothetical protein